MKLVLTLLLVSIALAGYSLSDAERYLRASSYAYCDKISKG